MNWYKPKTSRRGEKNINEPNVTIGGDSKITTYVIFFLMCSLLILGLTNLYSAAAGSNFFESQMKNLVIGLVSFFIFALFIPMSILNKYALWFYGLIAGLLIFVLVYGRVAGGSQRWIKLGFFSGQPSEFAKLAVITVIARFFFTTRSVREFELRDIWPPLLLAFLMFALILPQPDLGTAGVCLLVALGQFVFINIRKKLLVTGGVLGLVAGLMAWFFVLRDYQRLRVLNLFNPEYDPSGSGYNSLQSLIAVGSGKLFGKGHRLGTQTQLQFLPARHTDFIFSVFSEEHGFVGCCVTIFLFMSLCYVALIVAKQARDTFSSLMAVGIAALLFVSFSINTAMVLGLFPVVGVPLPFFSHGGTALILNCTALGILVRIDRETRGVASKSRSLSKELESRRGIKM